MIYRSIHLLNLKWEFSTIRGTEVPILPSVLNWDTQLHGCIIKDENKHHYEYWIDMRANRDATFEGKPIPTRYVVEMFCDRVAASKVYQGSAYADDSALKYLHLEQSADGELMFHPESQQLLESMLTWLAEEGETAAFKRIKREIVKAHYTTPATKRFKNTFSRSESSEFMNLWIRKPLGFASWLIS